MPAAAWDDIRIFLAVAATGSLSAAAVALGSSQATVGRRLRALERSLGLRLAERVSNRIALTEAGRRIEARARAMTAPADGVLREARLIAEGGDEPVRITATGSVALFLATHLAELLAEGGAPLVVGASRERANLARRDADIAIRMRHLPDDGDLVARRLGRIAFSIYAPMPADANGPVIGLPRTDRRPSQSSFLDDWADGRHIVARLDDTALRHRAALSCGAATLLPCWLGDADPALTRLMAPPAALREDIYLMVHRELRDAAAIDAAVRSLVALFLRQASGLGGDQASSVSLPAR